MNLKQERDKFLKFFKNLSEILEQDHARHDLFNLIFREYFIGNIPSFIQPDGSFGASRSNWTYHTAFAMKEAANIMGYDCKFEVNGKRDGIIVSRTKKPEELIVAEWEWDQADVFGKGKELDKLWESTKKSKTAEAMLFTYCQKHQLNEFTDKICQFWKSKAKNIEDPGLYLHLIVHESAINRKILYYRLLFLLANKIAIWPDMLL